MKTTDALNKIWDSYQVTIDCLKIANHSVNIKELNFLKKTRFMTSTVDAAKNDIQNSRENADDYVILSLWVAFERGLIECLMIENQRFLNNHPNIFTQKFHQKIETELEYWRVDDALDLFKVIIEPQIIGQVKQVKRYRDWIAHKNPRKARPSMVTPKMAYSILLEITLIIDNYFKKL